MPETARLKLEQDPSYLQTLASIQDATGQPKAALQTFELLSQVYFDQQVNEPVDMQIQYGWLLLKAGDDRRLYSVVVKARRDARFNRRTAGRISRRCGLPGVCVAPTLR